MSSTLDEVLDDYRVALLEQTRFVESLPGLSVDFDRVYVEPRIQWGDVSRLDIDLTPEAAWWSPTVNCVALYRRDGLEGPRRPSTKRRVRSGTAELLEALRRENCLLVTGGAGTGKSTAARALVRALCSPQPDAGRRALPVLLDASGLTAENWSSWYELLEGAMGGVHEVFKHLPSERLHPVVVVDSLDELSGRWSMREVLNKWQSSCDASVVAFSRTRQAVEHLPPARQLTINGLDSVGRRTLYDGIRRELGVATGSDPARDEWQVPVNPLHITLAAAGGLLDQSGSESWSEAVDSYLLLRLKAIESVPDFADEAIADRVLRVLGNVAYHLVGRRKYVFSAREWAAAVDASGSALPVAVRTALGAGGEVGRILLRKRTHAGTESFHFAHSTLLNSLASGALAWMSPHDAVSALVESHGAVDRNVVELLSLTVERYRASGKDQMIDELSSLLLRSQVDPYSADFLSGLAMTRVELSSRQRERFDDLLSSPSEYDRARAQVLAERVDRGLVEQILRTAHFPSKVFERIATGGPRGADELARIAVSGDFNRAMAAVGALQSAGWPDRIERILGDVVRGRVGNGSFLLPTLIKGLAADEDGLQRLLSDASPNLKASMVKSLAEVGSVAVAALREASVDDRWTVREAAAEALASIASAEARRLCGGMAGDDDWRVRRRVALGLSDVGELASTEVACALATDPIRSVRFAAIWSACVTTERWPWVARSIACALDGPPDLPLQLAALVLSKGAPHESLVLDLVSGGEPALAVARGYCRDDLASVQASGGTGVITALVAGVEHAGALHVENGYRLTDDPSGDPEGTLSWLSFRLLEWEMNESRSTSRRSFDESLREWAPEFLAAVRSASADGDLALVDLRETIERGLADAPEVVYSSAHALGSLDESAQAVALSDLVALPPSLIPATFAFWGALLGSKVGAIGHAAAAYCRRYPEFNVAALLVNDWCRSPGQVGNVLPSPTRRALLRLGPEYVLSGLGEAARIGGLSRGDLGRLYDLAVDTSLFSVAGKQSDDVLSEVRSLRDLLRRSDAGPQSKQRRTSTDWSGLAVHNLFVDVRRELDEIGSESALEHSKLLAAVPVGLRSGAWYQLSLELLFAEGRVADAADLLHTRERFVTYHSPRSGIRTGFWNDELVDVRVANLARDAELADRLSGFSTVDRPIARAQQSLIDGDGDQGLENLARVSHLPDRGYAYWKVLRWFAQRTTGAEPVDDIYEALRGIGVRRAKWLSAEFSTGVYADAAVAAEIVGALQDGPLRA